MTYIPNNSIVHTSGIEVYSGSGTTIGDEDVVLTSIIIDKRIKAIRFMCTLSVARTINYDGYWESASSLLVCNTWDHLAHHYMYVNAPLNRASKNYESYWIVNGAKRTYSQRVNNSSSTFLPISRPTSSEPVIAVLNYFPSNTTSRTADIIGRGTLTQQPVNHNVIGIVYTESV